MPEKQSTVYTVKVNEFEFSFTKEQVDSADLIQKSPSEFNLVKDHKSVNAVLIKTDQSAKIQTIEIKGSQYVIQINDELDLILHNMGYNTKESKKIKEVIAPMPGKVLEIAVSEGQQVHKGDKILILVAMKMENSIMINTEATIKRIVVKTGQAVEKGQVLIELD